MKTFTARDILQVGPFFGGDEMAALQEGISYMNTRRYLSSVEEEGLTTCKHHDP